MQNKYKLPKDVYQSVIWIIRGQERREQVQPYINVLAVIVLLVGQVTIAINADRL